MNSGVVTFRHGHFSEVCFFGPFSFQIQIRDPNHGGRDITEELMAGARDNSNRTHTVAELENQGKSSQSELSAVIAFMCVTDRI
uniref:Uncharacterized protein n=1 Tax=Salarias fasciatus TaxID=181472 RepID=A0A672F1X0_SALFA